MKHDFSREFESLVYLEKYKLSNNFLKILERIIHVVFNQNLWLKYVWIIKSCKSPSHRKFLCTCHFLDHWFILLNRDFNCSYLQIKACNSLAETSYADNGSLKQCLIMSPPEIWTFIEWLYCFLLPLNLSNYHVAQVTLTDYQTSLVI